MRRILVLFILLLAPFYANAASLNFSPSSGSHTVGTTFPVTVYVASSDQAMNAASGVVSFPADKLEVVSLSKEGSIFSLWPTEPSFSNSQGTVSFEGVVLNPGYTGANGKLLTISFRARSAGAANMSFSSGSVLANDGTGTNILDGLRVATYTLLVAGVNKADTAEAPSKKVAVQRLDAPKLTPYPESFEEGDRLRISGTTYKNSDVTAYVRQGDKLITTEYTRSNGSGHFGVDISKRLEPGLYTITALVTNAQGEQSIESVAVVMSVTSICRIQPTALTYLVITLLALFVFHSIFKYAKKGRRRR